MAAVRLQLSMEWSGEGHECTGVRFGGWLHALLVYALGVGVKFVETAAAWIVWSIELAELVAKTKLTHTRTLSQDNARNLTQYKHFPTFTYLLSS